VTSPGRACPPRYRYRPGELAAAPLIESESAWVAGGLYGNPEALAAILTLVEAERAEGKRTALVFNGDFHWFDAARDDFMGVHRAVLAGHAIAGNVEMELADPQPGVGCGCGYPGFVGDAVVERSNRIIERLRAAAESEDVRRSLAALPRVLRLRIAGTTTGVIHGDPDSVAGWQLGYERVAGTEPALSESQVRTWASDAGVDAFACTHTCLPWAAAFGNVAVINNGSAGMPNFRGDPRVLVTRVAPAASPHPDALYFVEHAGVRWEAVAVAYDHNAWRDRFRRTWPPGTPAHLSYYDRITRGPDHDLDAATKLLNPSARRAG
jgi:hypothetical protein